jgi:apolipoprotein D and lipocalin family protein
MFFYIITESKESFFANIKGMKCKVALFALFMLITANASSAFSQELRTVPSVDLNRYAGRWYDIARYPNRFQKDCAGNTTADYKLLPNGRIEVLNQCRKSNGSTKAAKGEARIIDKATNSKLEVRFAPSFLSFLPFVWGDYWIIDLGSNYEYSVVGSPDRKYLWILAREPRLDEQTYSRILQRAASKGFDPVKVAKTPQG